jgi:hypothetical protein
MNHRRPALLVAAAIALVLAAPAAVAEAPNKVRVDFAKCPPNPPIPLPPDVAFIVVGNTTRDVPGALIVYGQPGSFTVVAPNVVYLEADYHVTAVDPARSFVASVGGRFDLAAGNAVLYGHVSDGWLLGAQVVDEFHATAPGCVSGTLTLTPKWNSSDSAD